MRGITRIKRTYRQARRHFVRGAVILMYHRVTNLAQDPYLLAVSPENFTAQLDYLEETCTIFRLDELVSVLDHKNLPPRAIAVTFDDGYIDTYTQALPMLQATGISATVFVASGQVGSQREYWWDNLERILLRPDRLPEQLSLTIEGRSYVWTTSSQTMRERARAEIFDLVKPLVSHKREAILDELSVWAGLSIEGRSQYYVVDREALYELAANPGITIGAHTVTHASLAHLSFEVQKNEIETSRAELEDWLSQPVSIFAYPYGKVGDYSPDTVQLVRNAGFKIACNSVCGSLEPGIDHLQLNRCGVHNWPIDQFRKNLNSFFYR